MINKPDIISYVNLRNLILDVNACEPDNVFL